MPASNTDNNDRCIRYAPPPTNLHSFSSSAMSTRERRSIARRNEAQVLARALVREYLTKRGFGKTLRVFDEEEERRRCGSEDNNSVQEKQDGSHKRHNDNSESSHVATPPLSSIHSRHLLKDLLGFEPTVSERNNDCVVEQEEVKLLSAAHLTKANTSVGVLTILPFARAASLPSVPLTSILAMLCSYRLRKRQVAYVRKLIEHDLNLATFHQNKSHEHRKGTSSQHGNDEKKHQNVAVVEAAVKESRRKQAISTRLQSALGYDSSDDEECVTAKMAARTQFIAIRRLRCQHTSQQLHVHDGSVSNGFRIPSDIVGVIATYLPPDTKHQLPLMLVSHTWLQGVLSQDGMSPKSQIRWPYPALCQRQPRKLRLTSSGMSLDVAALAQSLHRSKQEFLSTADAAAAAPAVGVEKITFCSCDNLSNMAFKHLAKIESLKSVVVSRCWRIDNRAFRCFLDAIKKKEARKETNTSNGGGKKMTMLTMVAPSLTSLSLETFYGISDEGLKDLSKLSSLTCLNLAHYHCTDLFLSTITDKGIWYISQLKQLRTFSIGSCCNITNACMKHLGKLPHLSSLMMRHCTKVSTAGLAVFLSTSTSLTSLDFVNRQYEWISDSSRQSPQLLENQKLHLLKTVTMRHAEQQVHTLFTQMPNLWSLDISCSSIHDVGLKAIATSIRTIVHLDMNDCCDVSDEGIKHLGGLLSLETLRLQRCYRITEVGIVMLHDSRQEKKKKKQQQIRQSVAHTTMSSVEEEPPINGSCCDEQQTSVLPLLQISVTDCRFPFGWMQEVGSQLQGLVLVSHSS